jgi:hypothetical protein
MKDKILKIAGVKSEAAFYKKFPTEAAFKKAHGKELKKAKLGASMAPEIGSYIGGETINNLSPMNYNELYDDVDLSITGMNQQKRMQAQNLAAQQEIAAKTGKGGGGGLQDLIKGIGSAASAMGKNGKKVKSAQGGARYMPDTMSYGSPAQGGQITQAGADAATAGLANQSSFSNIAKGIPVVGKLVGAFQANAAEKKAMKLADQTSKVSGIARQAADTRPEETRRRYVRPEDLAFGTQEMGSAYGTGTNYLSRNGSVIAGNPTEIQNTYAPNNTLYDDLGYEPLEDSDQVKQYRRGGPVYAQNGFMNQFSKFATSPQGGNVLNQAGTLAGGNNAGSQFGDAIGDAVKFIPGIGPIASAAIKPIANLVGGLLDRKPKKTAAFNAKTQANTQNIAFTSGVRGLQGQNEAFMEDGGWVSNDWQPQVIAKFGDHTAEDYYNAGHEGMDSLRSGGSLSGDYTPPSERAMETYAMGGELQTHWGGYAEPISYNPYLPDGGETVMFRGQSHDESDGKGRTGIGVTYGKKEQDSYTDYAEYGADADADVEVERNEPAVKLKDGTSGEDSLIVYGNLKIPNQYLDVIGDDKAKGKKFKSYIKDLSKVEARQNKIMEKSLKMIDDGDDTTAFGQLAFATAKAMNQGANMKLKEIAEKKQNAASLQSALNDTASEYGVIADDLAKGKIKIDKSNNNMAKFGKNIKKAQYGVAKNQPSQFDSVFNPADPFGMKELMTITPKYIGREETIRREDPDEVNFYAKKRAAGAASPNYAKIMAERAEQIKKQILPGKKLPKSKEDLTDLAIMLSNEVLPRVRPNYKIEQPDFSSEMMAAGMNQMDPVQAQTVNSYLTQPMSVSFQDQLNANQADFNSLQRLTGYNPAAQSALAAQKYAANSAILSGQFRANQGEQARTIEKNRDIMNQTNMTNLGIYDKQYERQSTAKSKTKAQAIEIAKSISDKLAKARKEQRMSDLEQQRYNFRFDANGRLINMNPFSIYTYGSGKPSMGGYDLEEGRDFTYNRAGKIVGTRALKKDEDSKNGGKIKSRNGSIVKAIKNL